LGPQRDLKGKKIASPPPRRAFVGAPAAEKTAAKERKALGGGAVEKPFYRG